MTSEAILDENVSLDVQPVLEARGFKVISIALLPDRGMTDISVFDMAKQHNALLVTRDRDFTNSIRFPSSQVEGILYLKDGNLKGSEEANLIREFLENHPTESFQGKLVFLSPHSFRIR